MFVTVFFDTEEWWTAPSRRFFELDRIILGHIIPILNKHKVTAVFNTLGKVAESYPSLIKKLSQDGHEIASHGYSHENFVQMSTDEINFRLEKTEKKIQQLIKMKPVGFRAPWTYHDERLYTILAQRGYLWASNTRIPHISKIYRPDIKADKVTDTLRKLYVHLKRAKTKKIPHQKFGLFEFPMVSMMDGELLNELDPEQLSREDWLDYGFKALQSQFECSKGFFNLNFHPWLIGTANRPELLDRILHYLRSQDVTFMTAKDLVKQENFERKG